MSVLTISISFPLAEARLNDTTLLVIELLRSALLIRSAPCTASHPPSGGGIWVEAIRPRPGRAHCDRGGRRPTIIAIHGSVVPVASLLLFQLGKRAGQQSSAQSCPATAMQIVASNVASVFCDDPGHSLHDRAQRLVTSSIDICICSRFSHAFARSLAHSLTHSLTALSS